MTKLKQLTSKLKFLKQRKYILSIGAFLVITLILGFMALMYFQPFAKVDIDVENGSLNISKFPLYDSKLVIRNDEKEIYNNSLNRGISQDISFEKEDGKYTYELTIGNKKINGVFTIDTVAPEIVVNYPEYTNSEEIEISFGFNEELASTALQNQDEETITIEDNKASLRLKNGENNFKITVTDNYDNESSSEFKITLDADKPTIEVINPTSAETYDGSLEVKVKISDSSPIEKVTINDKEAALKDDGNYSVGISLKEGNNDITITVTDKAGNSESTKKSINKKTQQAQTYNGGGSTEGGNNSGGGNNGGGSSCATALSGSNIHCWNNINRANAGQSAISWNAGVSNMAYWYAYCIHTTGFSGGNPHQPTQAVKDCLTNNGQPIDRSGFGAEVIATGYGSSDAYANAWKNSSAHAAYVLSPYASSFGVAVYGNWAVGYIQ